MARTNGNGFLDRGSFTQRDSKRSLPFTNNGFGGRPFLRETPRFSREDQSSMGYSRPFTNQTFH